MTDDTSSKDDPFVMDESPAHHAIAGRTGTGKTTRLTELDAHTERWFDPKSGDEDVAGGSTGKTARFIELMATIQAESAPEWTDPKADDGDDITGGD